MSHQPSQQDKVPSETSFFRDENCSIAILMCTFNGETYLNKQMQSIIDQSFKNWTLYISDDGSTDRTLEILQMYQSQLGSERVKIYDGPRKGFGRNFISLLKRPEINADFFSFSDQDDIWHPEKLKRSLEKLCKFNRNEMTLYCSRTRIVNSVGKPTGYSPLFSKPASFQNALVQSIAGANTMLVSSQIKSILTQLPEHYSIVAHDWLIYLLVTAQGGSVFYDPEPCLDYRQHEGNVIGANSSYAAKLKRLKKMMSGRFSEWNSDNLKILRYLKITQIETNRHILYEFEQARNSSFLKRLKHYQKSGVYRQTFSGNISLFFAVAFKKI